MRLHLAAAGILLALASAATPARAQNVQQMLKGLTTGNQGQDQALRDAFERGYQKGRQDEAQMQHSGRANNGGYRQGSSDNDRNYGNNNDYNRNQPSYEEQGNNTDRR